MEGFGKNLLCVSCSFFGESVMLGLSRAMNWEERTWNIYCWRHYMIGFQSFAFFCQGIPRMPALPKFSLALYFKLIAFSCFCVALAVYNSSTWVPPFSLSQWYLLKKKNLFFHFRWQNVTFGFSMTCKGDAKHGYILIETIYTNIYNHAFMFSH